MEFTPWDGNANTSLRNGKQQGAEWRNEYKRDRENRRKALQIDRPFEDFDPRL